MTVECQVASTGNTGTHVSGISGFTICIKLQCIRTGSKQIKLSQAITDIQSVIIGTTGQAIVIGSFCNFLSVLYDCMLNTVCNALSGLVL